MRACGWMLGLLLLAAATAGADPKADAVLAKTRNATASIKSLEGELVQTLIRDGKTTTTVAYFRLLRPNLGQVRVVNPDGKGDTLWISDGKKVYVVRESAKEYATTSPGEHGEGLAMIGGPSSPLRAFLTPDRIGVGLRSAPSHQGPTERDGKPYQIIRAGPNENWYVANDGLLEGVESQLTLPSGKIQQSAWIRKLKRDTGLEPKVFTYQPPADFKAAASGGSPKLLLEVGSTAPSFSLPGLGGKTVELNESGRGKKGTILHFWFSGNATAASDELPTLQKLHQSLKAGGMEVIGVNGGEPAGKVEALARRLKIGFPMALSTGESAATFSKSYDIRVYPTTYLLDGDGKIVWGRLGWDPSGLRAAVTRLGFKP